MESLGTTPGVLEASARATAEVSVSKIAGACLCGAVKYSSPDEPAMQAVCHCKDCQRQAGTAFSVVVAVPALSLKIEGEENLSTYQGTGSSGKSVQRRFCRSCGSPILSVVEMIPELLFIKSGTLDDPSWLRPTMNIWCDSAQPWYEFPKGAQTFPQNPPG